MQSRRPLAVAGIAVLALSCGDGTVEPAPPPTPVATSVTVSPGSATLTAIEETARFTAEVRDQNGQGMAGAAVAWTSSDASVAAVDASGQVTAAANGSATITATAGSVSGTAAVTVAQVVSAVVVTPAADTLVALGDTVRLAAEAADANGHAVGVSEFQWASSDTLVAVVDGSGLVTAAGNGSATITAAAGGATGTAVVTVVQAAGSVTVEPAEATLSALGDTVRLAAEAFDANGNEVVDPRFSWSSSDAAVATVDSTGLVTAVSAGSATITAAAGGATGTAVVTVVQAAGSVTVEPAEATLSALGDTVRLAAEAFDANGNEVVDAQFSWSSSDAAVATVDSTGLVTAAGSGTATISASAGNASATARITVVASADSPDRRTLETLYETTLGAGWTNATNWLTSAPVGEWHGVEVDASGRVIGLALAGNNLAGWMPPEVGDLDRLRYLHVDHNELTGQLPPELADATGLASLKIGDNTLSGPLPRSLLALSLAEFRYADTELCVPPYDTFRDWLGGIASHAGTGVECAPLTDREILVRLYEATDGPNWRDNTNWLTEAPLRQWHGVTTDAGGRVQSLDLLFNGLQGVLPPELGGLSNLQSLHLGTAQGGLTGPIPPELGQLGQLRHLSLAHNGLVGPIPPEIGNASGLQILQLENNRLTGPIPPELGQLTRLESLSLQQNTLSGEIPPTLGDLPRLLYLQLHRNLLLGPVPVSLLRLDLRRFDFSDNLGLCAPGTTRFVSWLARMDHTNGGYCNAGDAVVLEQLHEASGGAGWTRSDGWLAGQPLSDWYGVVTDSLGHVQELDLNRNGLAGALPSTLGDLSGLTTLRIGGNTLSGPLPLSLTQLPLRELHYANTSLCAPVDGGFQEWLNGVSSHSGTGLECAARDDRAVLETLYQALDGPNWKSQRWLADRRATRLLARRHGGRRGQGSRTVVGIQQSVGAHPGGTG